MVSVPSTTFKQQPYRCRIEHFPYYGSIKRKDKLSSAYHSNIQNEEIQFPNTISKESQSKEIPAPDSDISIHFLYICSMSTSKISVVLVEDHALQLEGMAVLLAKSEVIRVQKHILLLNYF